MEEQRKWSAKGRKSYNCYCEGIEWERALQMEELKTMRVREVPAKGQD